MSRRPASAYAGVLAVAIALVAITAGRAGAEDAAVASRTLLGAWHEDPTRIDRARALLEGVAEPDATALIERARVWFLTGDFRARGDVERLAAYERGIEAARRAVALAPRSEEAHLWLAINSGRWAELKGIMKALATLSTIREESATVLRLNPSSVDGLILAGGLAAEVPALMGGDRAKAERYFTQALQIDPHHTGGRLELAKLYLTTRRWRDARRELQRILDEPAPTDVPRWTVSEVPRARALLADLGSRGAPTPVSEPQSP